MHSSLFAVCRCWIIDLPQRSLHLSEWAVVLLCTSPKGNTLSTAVAKQLNRRCWNIEARHICYGVDALSRFYRICMWCWTGKFNLATLCLPSQVWDQVRQGRLRAESEEGFRQWRGHIYLCDREPSGEAGGLSHSHSQRYRTPFFSVVFLFSH